MSELSLNFILSFASFTKNINNDYFKDRYPLINRMEHVASIIKNKIETKSAKKVIDTHQCSQKVPRLAL